MFISCKEESCATLRFMILSNIDQLLSANLEGQLLISEPIKQGDRLNYHQSVTKTEKRRNLLSAGHFIPVVYADVVHHTFPMLYVLYFTFTVICLYNPRYLLKIGFGFKGGLDLKGGGVKNRHHSEFYSSSILQYRSNLQWHCFQT